MKLIRTRFCGYKNGWACASAELRRIVVGENLEFLDGIDGGQNGDTAAGKFIVVDAVQKPICALGARTADGKGVGSTGRDFAAWSAIEETTRVRLLRRTGREGGELDEITAVQRQIGNLFGRNDLAQTWIRGFNRDFAGAYLNRG